MMRSTAFFLACALTCGFARAMTPGIAELDADARSAGNMKDLAVRIGERIFSIEWPAQVTQVSANGVDGHIIVGVRISGVKFHGVMSRSQFLDEIRTLVAAVFAASPGVEEVDVWASVPIVVGKDVVVSGDLAVPTTRPVYSVAVLRGSNLSKARAFWDEDWASRVFKQDW